MTAPRMNRGAGFDVWQQVLLPYLQRVATGEVLGDAVPGLLAAQAYMQGRAQDAWKIPAETVATGLLAYQGDPRARQQAMDMAAISPGLIGDVVGPVADTHRFYNFPETRTAGEAGLAALGALPFVPHLGGVVGENLTDRAVREGVGRSRRRVGTTGQYIGAPPGIDSPQKLSAMRKRYMDYIEQGIDGADWYDDASAWIRKVSNEGDIQRNADMLGITSQGTNVDTNLGFTAKGLQQYATDMPINTGRFPDRQTLDIGAAIAGGPRAYGPKRQPYADNLSVNWNPEMARHPVHDIWQGRAFGYEGPNGELWDQGFSSTQHDFLDEQMEEIVKQLNAKKVGGRTDWDPLKAQAAAWSGVKAAQGNIKPGTAAMHYGDFSPKYQANATYEEIPYADSGHLTGITDMPLGVRQAYTDMATWKDAKGRDSLYGGTGLLTEPSQPMIGTYTPKSGVMETNPGLVGHPLVQTEDMATGIEAYDKSHKTLRPEARGLLGQVESGRAYVDVQGGGAWNKPIIQGAKDDQIGLNIPGNVTAEQAKQLTDWANRHGYMPASSGHSTVLINDPWSDIGKERARAIPYKQTPNARLKAELKGPAGKELKGILGDIKPSPIKVESGYADYEDAWRAGEGSGEATRKFLDDMDENIGLAGRIEPALQEKALANMKRDAEFAKQHKVQVRQDIQRARKILAQKGIKGLRDALARNAVLPAAVFAVAPFLRTGNENEATL